MKFIARNLAWLFLRLYEPRLFECQGARTEALVLPSVPLENETSESYRRLAGNIQKPALLYWGREKFS